MKKTFLLSSFCMVAALASQSALAVDFKIRAGAGSANYELGGDYIVAISDYSPTTVGGALAFDNGMYIDLSYTGGKGKHDGWAGGGYPSENFERSDTALTFGGSSVNESSGIALGYYAGIKQGTTTLGAQNVWYVSWMEETLETSGLVMGGGASFPIASGRGGFIGLNLGLGLMNAEWKDDTGFNAEADAAVGGSFGVSYTYQFIPNLGVTVDYKVNSYSYNFSTAVTTDFTVDESISALGATVYVKF